jgi:hypothetical protein
MPYFFTQKTNAPGTNFSSNAIEVLKKAQPQTQWATKVETAFNRCIVSVSSEYFEAFQLTSGGTCPLLFYATVQCIQAKLVQVIHK